MGVEGIERERECLTEYTGFFFLRICMHRLNVCVCVCNFVYICVCVLWTFVLPYQVEDLDILWATKIGGPSHGFDYETPCILPLLSNSRHKAAVIDAAHLFASGSVGRAHVRLLEWPSSSSSSSWLLYLEPLNIDFDATDVRNADYAQLEDALLMYAIRRSIDIGVNLVSVGSNMASAVDRIFATAATFDTEGGRTYTIRVTSETNITYTLHPSNGVIEASDTLSSNHDWLQDHEEQTDPLHRVHIALIPMDRH